MDSFEIACFACFGSRCISFRKRKAIRVNKIETHQTDENRKTIAKGKEEKKINKMK